MKGRTLKYNYLYLIIPHQLIIFSIIKVESLCIENIKYKNDIRYNSTAANIQYGKHNIIILMSTIFNISS